MGRKFIPARVNAGIPSVLSGVYTTGQTFKEGALLIYVAAGTLSESGADPSAEIAGVALENAGSKPGYDAANSPTVVTGRVQEVSFAKADRTTVFSGRAIGASVDPAVPLQTHINEQYGVAKVGNDWVIDLDETSAKVVEIVDIDIDNKIFFFKFMEAVIATN